VRHRLRDEMIPLSQLGQSRSDHPHDAVIFAERSKISDALGSPRKKSRTPRASMSQSDASQSQLA
jgi:hypothetical protein